MNLKNRLEKLEEAVGKENVPCLVALSEEEADKIAEKKPAGIIVIVD